MIHGLSGNDYIRIGGGSDTILYGRGDGSDIIEGTSNSLAEHDKLVLTNLAPADVELSRASDALVIKVKATAETIVDLYFFSGSTSVANWNSNAWGIESIAFANGETWGRDRIQLETPIKFQIATEFGISINLPFNPCPARPVETAAGTAAPRPQPWR